MTDFSIIILSQARPDALARMVDYCLRTFDARIIVSDDSAVSPVLPPQVQYFNHHGKSMWDRMALAGAAVETEFCLIGPDDDYAMPKGVSAALSRLRETPSASVAQGLALEYRAMSQSHFEVLLKYRNTLTPYVDGTLRAEHAVSRIENLTESFFHVFWSIYRTSAFRKLMGVLTSAPLDFSFIEYGTTFGANLIGPVEIVNSVLFVRDVTPSRLKADEKASARFVSQNPHDRAQADLLINLLAQCSLPELQEIRRYSRLNPSATSAQEWLRFCLHRLASGGAKRKSTATPLQPVARVSHSDESFTVSMDAPSAMGDRECTINDVLPILRLVHAHLRPGDLFPNRFGVPAHRSTGVSTLLRPLMNLSRRLMRAGTS